MVHSNQDYIALENTISKELNIIEKEKKLRLCQEKKQDREAQTLETKF